MSFLHSIKKCADAIENHAEEITVWGTGQATREFSLWKTPPGHRPRSGEAITKSEPVNIGPGFDEISIKDLVA